MSCSEVAAKKIAEEVEGVGYIYNPNGCCQSHKGTAVTLEILSGMIANGNIYGSSVGLGCETTQKSDYINAIKAKTNKPVYFSASKGGIKKTVNAGVKIVKSMKKEADKLVKKKLISSELILGLECGGSDPTSGVSSNTVLGNTSDRIIDFGGTAVLSGTSKLLVGAYPWARGRTPEIGQIIYDAIIKWEKDRYEETGEDVRTNNPTPGNKEGGLTTLSKIPWMYTQKWYQTFRWSL